MRFSQNTIFKPSLDIANCFGKELCLCDFSRVTLPVSYHSELFLKQARHHFESGVVNAKYPSTMTTLRLVLGESSCGNGHVRPAATLDARADTGK